MSKIIHQFWNTGIAPLKYSQYTSEWKEMYPEWEYKLWSYETASYLLSNSSIDQRLLQYDIQRWDLLKLLICLEFGGIYTDLDVQPIQIIDIDRDVNYFAYESIDTTTNLYLHHNFFYSPKQSRFLQFVIKHIHKYFDGARFSEISNKPKNIKVRDTTGPIPLTALYSQYSRKEEVVLLNSKNFLFHYNHKAWY